MLRRVVPPAIIATVAAGAVCFIMLRDHGTAAAPLPQTASVEDAELAALKRQVARLEHQVSASQRIDAPPASSSTTVVPEEKPYDEELAADSAHDEGDAVEEVVDVSVERQAAVERTALRFGMLGERVSEEGRDTAWASSREREIAALTTQNDYFKTTRFDTIECRTTLCRVVASFQSEQDQTTFAETFPGFVGQLPYAAMREIPDTNPPRIEVFLSATGPLPRD